MKRILIAVDFSENAHAAFQYGVGLAAHMKSQLVMLIHVQEEEGSAVAPDSPELVQERISSMAHHAEKALGEGVTVLFKILQGKPAEVIERLAYQVESDLIIVGNTGTGHAEDRGCYLGTVSGGLFKHTELPLLFVPRNGLFKVPEKLTFIVRSLMIYKPGAMKPMLQLAAASGADVAVVQIKANNFEAAFGKESNMDFEGIEHYVYQLSCDTVAHGVTKVIETFQPDVLCGIRRKRDFFESMFQAHHVLADDFYCDRPLLILQGARV